MNKSIVWLIAALVLAGCSRHDHDAKETNSDKAAEAHGHAHGGDLSITHYSDAAELFVEFPRLVKGEEAAFAAHVTKLADFSALGDGTVVVALTGGGNPDEKKAARVSDAPGIFRPTIAPRYSGKRRLVFYVHAPGIEAVHDVGEVEVYENKKAAEAAAETPSADAGIKFTKEQQWKTEFSVGAVSERAVRESLSVNAVLRPRPAGEAHVATPAAGLLRAGSKGFPQIGMQVGAGQILAYLVPRLGGESDAAALDLAIARARIEANQANLDRERLEGLLAAEAVAEKRVRDARTREALAGAELLAAERRAATYAGGTGGIPLKTPIAGSVVSVTASPGAAVTEGQTIAHIADLARLWLEARVPESELARLGTPAGAFFRLDGDERVTVLETGKNAHLVASGGMVDRETRTAPVIFEFENPNKRLRAGMNLQVNVYTGRVLTGPAIPVSAVVDDAGQAVVYIQQSGESFERRVVQPGMRDGDWVAITRGLKAGERVVTKGAYDVRLAAAAPAAAGHGHAH